MRDFLDAMLGGNKDGIRVQTIWTNMHMKTERKWYFFNFDTQFWVRTQCNTFFSRYVCTYYKSNFAL